LFITILSLYFLRPLLEILKTPPAIIEGAYTYMSIILKGLPFILMYNFEAAILRALGDSKTPFYLLIVSCFLNIVGDLLFVLVFNFEIKGVAYATVISNIFVAIASLIYIYHKYPELKLSKNDFIIDLSMMKSLLALAFPAALQNSVNAIGCMILQLQINKLGEVAVAGYTIGVKFEGIFCALISAVALTMITFSGQNYGANNFVRIKKGIKISSFITIAWAIFAFIFIQLFDKNIVTLMVSSDESEVIQRACDYLFATSVFYIPLAIGNIFNCSLQGMGKGYFTMITSFQELVTRSLGAIILPPLFGYLGACFSGSISWVVSAIMVSIGYYILVEKKEAKKALIESN
jgi:putative MATE family efflux protein